MFGRGEVAENGADELEPEGANTSANTSGVWAKGAVTLFTDGERRVLVALGEAMFAEDGEASSDAIARNVLEVERLVASASAPVRFGLRVALLVLRVAPVLLYVASAFVRELRGVRPTTLDRLPVASRVRALEFLERTRVMPLCLAFMGWRTLQTLVFYEDPRELAALGYGGDARARYKRTLPVVPAAVRAEGDGVPIPLESGVRLRPSLPPRIGDADDEEVLPPVREADADETPTALRRVGTR